LNVLIGKNVEAGRIMAVSPSAKQNSWTSLAAHETCGDAREVSHRHAGAAFGIQLVYTNPRDPSWQRSSVKAMW
jgi:hypothetical protein